MKTKSLDVLAFQQVLCDSGTNGPKKRAVAIFLRVCEEIVVSYDDKIVKENRPKVLRSRGLV